MKKVLLAVLAIAMSLGAVAQVKARWGSIDVRYSLDCSDVVSDCAVNNAVAWRGERVNLQLVVENGAKESRVEYRFSDLKCGRSVIPAENVVGGFVQPVLTDKFTGCGRHEVDAHGEVPVADRITATSPTLLDAGARRGLWLTIQVPQDAKPGLYKGYVELVSERKKQKFQYTVKVLDRTLPAPKDWKFHLDLWQNPYAVARVHNVELWSEEHFNALACSFAFYNARKVVIGQRKNILLVRLL